MSKVTMKHLFGAVKILAVFIVRALAHKLFIPK
jgi:hypothetical protein